MSDKNNKDLANKIWLLFADGEMLPKDRNALMQMVWVDRIEALLRVGGSPARSAEGHVCNSDCGYFYCPVMEDSKVEKLAKTLSINDNLWTSQEAVEKNLLKFYRAALPGSLPSEETRYLKLLRWFKLFYGFFQEDVKGKPSACASALSEDAELQEFVREANTIE